MKFLIAFLILVILGSHGLASGTWTIDTVDGNGGDFRFTSLARDDSGNPHISYQNCNDEGLRYATENGSVWTIETVVHDNRTGFWTALEIDQENEPHIVCYSLQTSDLEYIWKNESGWQSDKPPTNGHAAWTPAPFRLGSDGYPRIIMADRFTTELSYFWKNETGWYSEPIPDTRYSSYPDLILDMNDRPHVSFLYDRGSSGYVRYATLTESGWHTEIVDNSVNVWGAETSIRLDPYGSPVIAYYDRTNLDLRYSTKNESGWQIEIADAEGDIGDQCSLFIDPGGFPHISSYCTSKSALEYTWKDDTGWHHETVDDGDVGTGWYSSLTLDTYGYPVISYGDYTTGSLKLARKENLTLPPIMHIKSTSHSGGTINPSGFVEVPCGSSATFTFVPDPGYSIDNVTIDGSPSDRITEYTFTGSCENHTVEVSFSPTNYIIFSESGDGGTIDPLGEVRVDYGANQTFVISPDPGYTVSDIFIDESPLGIFSHITGPPDGEDSREITFPNVTAGHTLHVEFIREGGTILEIQDPPGATVYVDGMMKGLTPLALTDVAPGRHTVTVSLEGYQDWSKKVNVAKDTVTRVSPRLALVQAGSISIQSNPEGASIVLDDEETGNVTPSVLTPIETGEHTIKLLRPGYSIWTKIIEVRSNATVHILANLNRGQNLF